MKNKKLKKIIIPLGTLVGVASIVATTKLMSLSNDSTNKNRQIKTYGKSLKSAMSKRSILLNSSSSNIKFPAKLNVLINDMSQIFGSNTPSLASATKFVEFANSLIDWGNNSNPAINISSATNTSLSTALSQLGVDITKNSSDGFIKPVVDILKSYINGSAQSFPSASLKQLQDYNDLDKVFKKWYNIQDIDVDTANNEPLEYSFPDTSSNKMLNNNLTLSNVDSDSTIASQPFIHKMLDIDLTSLAKMDHSSFSYKDTNGKIIKVVLNNSLDKLKSAPDISSAISSGGIIIRDGSDTFDQTTPNNNKIKIIDSTLHLNIENQHLVAYSKLNNVGDTVLLSTNLSNSFASSAKVGYLENSALPSVLSGNKLLNIDSTAVNSFDANRLSSNYKGGNTTNYSLKFYAQKGTTIELPVTFNGTTDWAEQGNSNKLSIKIDDSGKVEVPSRLNISTKQYKDGIDKINVETRSYGDWTEITITTPKDGKDVFVGDWDDINSKASNFDLQELGLDSKPIVFEEPASFTGKTTSHEIGYKNVVNITKEAKELLGKMYYKAWDKSFNSLSVAPSVANDIKVDHSSLPFYEFKNDMVSTKNWTGSNQPDGSMILDSNSKPNSSKLVANSVGALVEKLNNYSNDISDVLKSVTGNELFSDTGTGTDHFLPSGNELDFSTNVLLQPRSILTQEILYKLGIIASSYINGGPSVANEYTDKSNPNYPKDKNEEKWYKEIEPDILNLNKNDKNNEIKLASPLLTELIKEKFKNVSDEYNKQIEVFKKQKILDILLDANKNSNPNVEFKSMDNASGKSIDVEIGKEVKFTKKMDIFDGQVSSFKNVDSFKNSLTTIIRTIKSDSDLMDSALDLQEKNDFIKLSDLLLNSKSEREKDATNVNRAADLLFKVIDSQVNDPNFSMQALYNIHGKYIKDDGQRLKAMVDHFNEFISSYKGNATSIIKVLGVRTSIKSDALAIANSNLQKIFDVYSKQPGLSEEQIKKINEYSKTNFAEEPNKIGTLAFLVKDGEYSHSKKEGLDRFIQELVKDDIKGVANAILDMDITKDLPTELPPESPFVDVINGVGRYPEIIFGILGAAVMLIGVLAVMLGLKGNILSKKTGLIIGSIILAAGLALAIIAVIAPATGALSLLAF